MRASNVIVVIDIASDHDAAKAVVMKLVEQRPRNSPCYCGRASIGVRDPTVTKSKYFHSWSYSVYQ